MKKHHPNNSLVTSDLYNLEENNWTPLPNEIIERLSMTRLGAHEAQIMWCLLRKTLGFHPKDNPKHLRKKLDQISLSQFEAMTGLDRRRVHEALKRLKERRIITVLAGRDRQAKTYGINFNISQWQLSYMARTETKRGKGLKSVLVGQDSSSCAARTEGSYPARTDLSYSDAHTKERKESIKEKIKEIYAPRGADFQDNGDKKKLSALRNEMFKSGLYTDDELSTLRDKCLSDLETIHARRVLGKAEALAFTEGAVPSSTNQPTILETAVSGADAGLAGADFESLLRAAGGST